MCFLLLKLSFTNKTIENTNFTCRSVSTFSVNVSILRFDSVKTSTPCPAYPVSLISGKKIVIKSLL